jgi:hypothetical protein
MPANGYILQCNSSTSNAILRPSTDHIGWQLETEVRSQEVKIEVKIEVKTEVKTEAKASHSNMKRRKKKRPKTASFGDTGRSGAFMGSSPN